MGSSAIARQTKSGGSSAASKSNSDLVSQHPLRTKGKIQPIPIKQSMAMLTQILYYISVTYCIYAIIDPRNDQVFYVGHSSSFKRRCEQHKKGQDSLSGLTIRQIKQNGFVPLFIRLENCQDKSNALMAEIFWIELFKSRGTKLTNAQGFAGYDARASERKKQTRQLDKMSKAKKGVKGKAKNPRKTKQEKLEEIANGRPIRQGKSWTKSEDKRLLGMKKKRLSEEMMADNLGRSITSIRMRFQALEKQS